MKKRIERISNFVGCPFCGYKVETSNPGAWCAGCLVEYKLTENYVIFDTDRNEFPLARTLAAAGGVRIGRQDELSS